MNNPENTHNLKDKPANKQDMEWFNLWTREYGVQYSELIISAMAKGGPSRASILEKHILYPENRNEAAYLPMGEKDALYSEIGRLIDDEAALDREILGFERSGREYVEVAKDAGGRTHDKLENGELLKLYNLFWTRWEEYTSYLWTMFTTNEIMSHRIEKLLEEKAKELAPDELNALVKYSTTPSKMASVLKLNHELKELRSDHCDRKLEEICNKYRWISCLDIHYEPWGKENVKEYYNSHDHQEADGFKDIVNLDSLLSEEEKRLVELNRKLTYYKELRDEYRRIGICHAQPLFREIGRRAGLTLREVSYLKKSEIQEFLLNGNIPEKEAIAQRFNGFLVFEKDGEIVCVSGTEIDEQAQLIGFKRISDESGEVKGKIASKGKAKGKAKIVLNERDLPKIGNGDVLVALTTGPSYVPAMAKAAAFVTDQGGITCHAAIVAREMKKPCVVGTGNSTQVLKDGDLVEVDADEGIVKRLKG